MPCQFDEAASMRHKHNKDQTPDSCLNLCTQTHLLKRGTAALRLLGLVHLESLSSHLPHKVVLTAEIPVSTRKAPLIYNVALSSCGLWPSHKHLQTQPLQRQRSSITTQ